MWDLLTNRKDLMKYFILSKFKYMRGYEHDMPANERCKNGFDNLEQAKQAVTEETLVQKTEKWQQDYAMQFCQFSNKKNEQVECYAT